MNKVTLSGKILKEIIITCGNNDNKNFCYLSNKFGNYLINIDNSLLKSIGDFAEVTVEGKLNYQKINSQNSHFWYVDAEKIVDNQAKLSNNYVKIDINVLHITEFYNHSYLIFGQIDKSVESIVEVEYTGELIKDKNIQISGLLIPQQLDKNGFFEYIINANKIEIIKETERENYEELQM